ncbi:MAG: hypothetical protein BIFFINMI_03500 [Phycisphaerae bacterium]|nr:hypothetical protein [Phycisphaerae bacterium]
MVATATFWIVLFGSAVVYWLLPVRWRAAFLSLTSAGYLLTVDAGSVAMLIAWTLVFFFAARGLAPGRRRAGRVLAALICTLLGCLAAFKYLPQTLAAMGLVGPIRHWWLPLGISYFTFKLIHFAIESWHGHFADIRLDRFLLYMLLLPIYPAGPIERLDHFVANARERFNGSLAVSGLTRIIVGLIKTFVLGELIAGYWLEHIEIHPMLVNLRLLTPLTPWWRLGWAFLYAYFNFAGYADIAIGGARLFGLGIMENFNFPFLAPTIGNFWKRWHMTLSGWCMHYIYLPIIGLARSPWLAVLATFTAIGVWHGASPNWLGWGLYHAAGVSAWVAWTRLKRRWNWRWPDRPVLRPLWIAMTMLFVISSYAFIVTEKSGGLGGALRLLAKLVCVNIG